MRIALLTDFGTRDPYAGELALAILAVAPEARVVALTHDVRPFDIRHGAFLLWASWRHVPPGTAIVAVVDPGVGTARGTVLAHADGRLFVGPDNGLFACLRPDFPDPPTTARFASAEPLLASLPRPAGATFHGRDLFGPLAAHVFGAPDLASLPEAPPPAACPGLFPEVAGQTVRGRILHVDRFGDLVSNIPASLLGPRFRVELGGHTITGPRTTFGDVPVGEPPIW